MINYKLINFKIPFCKNKFHFMFLKMILDECTVSIPDSILKYPEQDSNLHFLVVPNGQNKAVSKIKVLSIDISESLLIFFK